jgi:general secretion pathway protein B
MALSELDAGSRKQLPALKMSMHMWNQDEDRRFVILDGQRLGEGDLVGEAQIESITREGVILNWQGARLRIDTR